MSIEDSNRLLWLKIKLLEQNIRRKIITNKKKDVNIKTKNKTYETKRPKNRLKTIVISIKTPKITRLNKLIKQPQVRQW